MQIRRPAKHRVSFRPSKEPGRPSKRRQNQINKQVPLRVRLHKNHIINAARTKIRGQRPDQDPLHLFASPSQ